MSRDSLEAKTTKQELLPKCEGVPLRQDLSQLGVMKGLEGAFRLRWED